jgi:hypothetical protein
LTGLAARGTFMNLAARGTFMNLAARGSATAKLQ